MGIEILSILGPTRVNLDGVGGGRGSLTPDMVAGALGSVRDRAGAELLIADLVGREGYRDLENQLHDRLMHRAFHEGWIVKQPRTLQGLTRLMLRVALYELLMPRRCPRCEGRLTRYVREHRKEIPCPRCQGQGNIPLTERERARMVDMNHEAWRNTWSGRYKCIQAWLADLYGSAAADVRNALK